MKKVIFIISLVSIASALFINIAQSKSLNLASPVQQSNTSSGSLPSTIKDALLLNAWENLNSQTQPITLWDGRTVTGHQLAQRVLDDHIVIVWDTKNICNGYSCAFRPVCLDAQCKGKDYPIYMGLYLKDEASKNIASLAALIAHELFHHSEPFGFVADSLFEEYWAYFIQSSISNSAWLKETQKDTLNPVCLHQWFVDHRMTHYFEHIAYPQSVSSKVEASAQVCLSQYSK